MVCFDGSYKFTVANFRDDKGCNAYADDNVTNPFVGGGGSRYLDEIGFENYRRLSMVP